MSDGPSLVDEIHQKRASAVIERKRARRRRASANIFFGILLFVGLVAAGVVVKILVDRHRLDSGLTTARTHLAASTPLDYDKAAAQLEQNLRLDPAHAPTLGMLALVRAHQAADGFIEPDLAQEAVDAATGREEAPLAAGILAGIASDFDEARRAYEAVDADAPVELASPAAWLQGLVALGRPYEKDLTDAALARIEAALERDPEWVPNLRMAAALLARMGKLDDAVAKIETARELAPAHVGLSIDEALYHALVHEHRSGVLEVTKVVLETPGTPPRDAAYARLARALALVQGGDVDEAVDQLEACWAALPVWDNHGRDLVLDALLSAGQFEKSKSLRKEVQLGSQADAIFEAWEQLLDGDAKDALEKLAELPQDLPRVAHLQALALVEQRRWDEAQRWIDFATAALPHRPDLAVAAARVQAEKGDGSAVERLSALAKDHPHAYRVWTALAVAHAQEKEPSKDATKEKLDALEKATKEEPIPSEAWFLLAQHYRALPKKTSTVKKAAEAYRKAIELVPDEVRFASEFGVYLAELGMWREAEAVLRKTIELEGVAADPYIVLARTVIDRAVFRKLAVPNEVEAWLADAAKLGADPWALEYEWARLQLARDTAQSLPQAQLRAQRILDAQPNNGRAWVVLASSLLQQRNVDAARAVAIKNAAKSSAPGQQMIAMSRVEVAEGGKPAKRRAIGWASRGWRKMVEDEAVTPAELMITAPFVVQRWVAVEEPRSALDALERLAKAAPFAPDAWVVKGEVQLAMDLPGSACVSASKAIELDEKHAPAQALLGDCLKAKGDTAKAKDAYEKAVDFAEGAAQTADYRRRAARL